MSTEEPVDLDPEVLADPLVDDDSSHAAARSADPANPSGPPTALAPTREGGLAPFDPFRRYMAEIRKYPPLTREEEQKLARRYRETGDREALFRLITANLMLVVRVALSFRRALKNLLDLVQEGNVGLLQAIDRFDPDLGVRLPTYAAYWVRAYMVKFLLDNVRLVRVGTTNARRKLLRHLHQEKRKLEESGFDVGPKLLAEHFGVSERDVIDVQAALDSRDLSLDAPVGEDEQQTRGDSLADPTTATVEVEVARKELQERTESALARFREGLKEREFAILERRVLSDEP